MYYDKYHSYIYVNIQFYHVEDDLLACTKQMWPLPVFNTLFPHFINHLARGENLHSK